MFADSWFGLYKSLLLAVHSTLTKAQEPTLYPFLTPRGQIVNWIKDRWRALRGYSGGFVGGERSQTLSYSWFMLSCLILSLEIDCRNKVEPQWVLGKHPAVVESRFRFTFPERKSQSRVYEADPDRHCSRAGNKESEPKISENHPVIL